MPMTNIDQIIEDIVTDVDTAISPSNMELDEALELVENLISELELTAQNLRDDLKLDEAVDDEFSFGDDEDDD